jgi:peptidoglycan hydrolase-like protein with peptidoglycan-binding domain
VDDQPVVALYGARPAYRSIGGALDLDVAAAEANLASAQAHLQELLTLPDPEAVKIAEVQLTDAEIQLELAQAAYDSVSWVPEISMLPQSFQLQAATNAYEIAKAQYDQAVEGATPAQIASAQAQVAQAQAALDALTSGPPLTHSGDDVRQLEEALVALGYDAGGALAAGDEFSPATADAIKAWQAEIGAHVDGVVDFGEVVFLPGPVQVLDVLAQPGSQAGSVMQLATGDPVSGADIQQLEEALLALGYDAGERLVADGTVTIETIQAVLAFQEATGLEQDGIIDLSEVIFLPGAVRITSQMVLKGSSVGAGATVFDVTLTERVVSIALPADQQGLLAAGDPVTVELPDSTLISATVTSISQNATPSASGAAFFEAQAALDDPGAVDGLDEAPVDVIAVSDAVTDVMAAPVSALVALLEGGYAVERDAGGGNVQLVAVDVGFFGSNNLVQITSDALQPGDRVVVP